MHADGACFLAVNRRKVVQVAPHKGVDLVLEHDPAKEMVDAYEW